MSYLLKEELLQSQDTWKRTQIRLTPTLNEAINNYAEKKNASFNSAMLELIDSGLTNRFSVIKDYGGKQNHIVLNLPTSVIAISPNDYSNLTLQQSGDVWMISYYGLRATIDNDQAQQLIDMGFSELPNGDYQLKSNRKIIFTEWNPTYLQDEDNDFMANNEKVRLECAKYMSDFFKQRPSYKLIKFEFKSRLRRIQRKDQEVLYGIRIWYSYPENE